MNSPKMNFLRMVLVGAVACLAMPQAGRAADPASDPALRGKSYLLPATSGALPVRGSRTPFLPPLPPLATDPTGAPIEFRGVSEDAKGRKFRLYDPARKLGVWVALNQRGNMLDAVPVEFRGAAGDAHDYGGPKVETLVVEYQGRLLTLSLCSSSTAAAVPPVMASSITERDFVHREIRRLRAVREQAAQTSPAAPANPPSAGSAPKE